MDFEMVPSDLRHIKLIPYSTLMDRPNDIPDYPGVYLFFLNGGGRMLETTAYYDMEARRPFSLGVMTHVYTGSAMNLRERLKQHLRTGIENSSIRKTLLTLEQIFGALSESGTPACNVKGQKTLTAWLRENAIVGYEYHREPVRRETQILKRHASPFNIAMRRHRPYAQALREWRCKAFPASEGRLPNRRLRSL
jgi:hypothetical protein